MEKTYIYLSIYVKIGGIFTVVEIPLYFITGEVNNMSENMNENINDNMAENITENNTEKNIENQNEDTTESVKNIQEGKAPKKKISVGAIVYPLIIIIILAAFGGTVYYAKVIKPKADIEKEIGYKSEDYIELGKYTGFDYEITQEDFDAWTGDMTIQYESVERAAQDKDQVEFDYIGYVDGKKDKNISETEQEIVLGDKYDDIYDDFAEAMKGHKEGEKITITVNDATELAEDESDYSNKNVTIELKIRSVLEPSEVKVSDKWVKEEFYEDYGLETTEDFYEWCKESLKEEAMVELWQKVLDGSKMNGYPQDVYDQVVLEFTQNANYYAEQWGMSTEEYMEFNGYTDEMLEEEYLVEVKSELVLWAIVKERGFDTTDEEIEGKYEELYLDVGYETVEEMKEDYTVKEIRNAVLLDKVQEYIYNNSNVVESFKIPQ